jgi:hypothetical protein
MVRLLQVLGVSAILGAGGVLALTVPLWLQKDSASDEIQNRPSAIEQFRIEVQGRQSLDKRTSPLIAEAEAFSRHLNPPKSAEKPAAPAERLPRFARNDMVSSALPVRPAAPSPCFKLRGTSYYPNRPGKSMALIAELGSSEGSERWVKEGTQVGHFVIEEIRRGVIVYRDGNNVREMAVERGASPPGIVRDIRPGSRRVSAAVGDTDAMTPMSAGPNSTVIAGGN